MVSFTGRDIRDVYGVDLHELQQSCTGVLVGVVTPTGVNWGGSADCQRPPQEEWLVEILRSKGEPECLFLQVDGCSLSALQEHCQHCPANVTTYWFPRNRCSCMMVPRRHEDEPAS